MKFFFLLALILSCSTATITKYKKLKPLPKNVEVTIFTPADPPAFDYEKICEIIIEKHGDRASSEMSFYVEDIKHEARKCGSHFVLLGTIKVFGETPQTSVIFAGATAILKTTDVRKLTEAKINKMVKAVKENNSKSLEALMEDLNRNLAKRTSYDSRVLEALLLMTSDKGLDCNPSLVKVLDGYHTTITQLKRGETTAKNLIFCGKLLSQNFHHITDHDALISYVGKQSSQFFKKYTGSKTDLRKLQSLQSIFPETVKEIKSACVSDPASKRCQSKLTFVEIKSVINKLKSKAKSTQASELKKTADLLSI